jgi:hypothetical protein
MQPSHWRTDIDDLRTRAREVARPTSRQEVQARNIAQCLSGVIGLAARRFTLDGMQQACAELARNTKAWETSLRDLPRGTDGRVAPPVELIAAAARGFYPLSGSDAIRSALAFWASESDPAVWMSLAQAA